MKRAIYNLLFIIFVVGCISTVKLDAQAEIYWNTAGEKTPQGEDYVSKYWNGRSWVYNGIGRKEIPKRIDVTYKVKYCYEEAYKMIDLVNTERRKAGVPELVAKDELMDAAISGQQRQLFIGIIHVQMVRVTVQQVCLLMERIWQWEIVLPKEQIIFW